MGWWDWRWGKQQEEQEEDDQSWGTWQPKDSLITCGRFAFVGCLKLTIIKPSVCSGHDMLFLICVVQDAASEEARFALGAS